MLKTILNGDTGAAVRALLNGQFAELYQRRTFPRQFRIATYGDSKSNLMGGLTGLSSLRQAMLHYPIDWRLVGSYGVSGKQISTAATHLANDAVLAPLLAAIAGGANTVLFKGFTNDSAATVDVDMAAFRKIHEKAREAGCQLFIVMGLNPASSTNTAAAARKFESIDQALRDYERLNDDVWYVPTTLALMDATSAFRAPITAPYPVMYDGIHESGYGAWQEGRVLAREFQRRGVPRRYPRTIFSGDTAYGPKDTTPPQSPAGNALGTQGTFDKPGNAAGMQVTGGGGVTGAEFWPGDNGGSMYTRLTGTLNGTAAIAISTQPCSFLNEEGFRSDITRPRLTLSGTPAASFALTLQIYRNLYQQQGSATTLPNNVTMESEFCWQAKSLVGLGNTRGPGSLGSGGVGQVYPALNGVYCDFSPAPYNVAGNSFGAYDFGITAVFEFLGGVELSGSIDLIGAGVRQVYPVQPAAS